MTSDNDSPVSGSQKKKPAGRDFSGPNISRGLPSIDEARAARRGLKWMPARFWRWAAVCIGAGLILWWKIEQGEINKMRDELLGRQRAVKATLGPRWYPLRDKIERWTVECGAKDFAKVEAPDLGDEWDFRGMPGIYLRLAQEHAGDTKALREAATKSLHDGFTSCLLRVNNPNPIAGKRCETTHDCGHGELCNDYKHCAAYSQPYNLRLAYRTMYIMSDEWTADIQEISNKLTVRGAVATFDDVNKYDLPVAADLLQRAKYFLVVVDEKEPIGKSAIDALPTVADAGAQDDQSIPTAPHMARVCVWRLKDDAKMLAVRDAASGMLVGGPKDPSPQVRISQQRQANSCALALAVREAMGVGAGAKLPEDAPADEPDGGAPDAGTSDGDAG